MRLLRSLMAPVMATSLLVVACDTESMPAAPDTEVDAPEALADYGHSHTPRTYQVTIYNLTDGQPFTPPVVASHNNRIRIFRRGHRAGNEVQQIAENGNNSFLLAALDGEPRVHDVFQGGGPILPGASMTFELDATRRMNRLSWVAMLICSNDGFAGSSSIRLPVRVGKMRTYRVSGWDAGTEKNTESFSDLVPPCPALTGVATDEMGTGMSNPALATDRPVRRHRGIRGVDDLIPGLHGWKGAVAKIEVKRIR